MIDVMIVICLMYLVDQTRMQGYTSDNSFYLYGGIKNCARLGR